MEQILHKTHKHEMNFAHEYILTGINHITCSNSQNIVQFIDPLMEWSALQDNAAVLGKALKIWKLHWPRFLFTKLLHTTTLCPALCSCYKALAYIAVGKMPQDLSQVLLDVELLTMFIFAAFALYSNGEIWYAEKRYKVSKGGKGEWLFQYWNVRVDNRCGGNRSVANLYCTKTYTIMYTNTDTKTDTYTDTNTNTNTYTNTSGQQYPARNWTKLV